MAPAKKSVKKPVTTKETTPNQPATQTTTSQPMPTSGKTNTMAVIALILAFFIPLIGLILGIVAISQIKKRNEGGKGLAIASIVVSIVIMVMQFIVVLAIAGGIFAAKSELNKQGVNIDTNNGSIDVKGKDGDSASIGNAKVPSGFPSSVPIYPGSKIVASSKGGNGSEYTVFMTTTDQKSTVENYYQNELQKNGWATESGGSSLDLGFASGAKYTNNGQQLVVTIAQDKDNNGTAITLIVTPEK